VFLERAREALGKHGLELDPNLIFSSFPNERGGYAIAQKLIGLQDRPTAIVLLNESLAGGLYRGLTESGCVPGRDIAVVGREGPQSHFLSPTLTCFTQSIHDLGVALGEALLASMPRYAEHYPKSAIRKLWPQKLVVGESDAFVIKKARKAKPEPTPSATIA